MTKKLMKQEKVVEIRKMELAAVAVKKKTEQVHRLRSSLRLILKRKRLARNRIDEICWL